MNNETRNNYQQYDLLEIMKNLETKIKKGIHVASMAVVISIDDEYIKCMPFPIEEDTDTKVVSAYNLTQATFNIGDKVLLIYTDRDFRYNKDNVTTDSNSVTETSNATLHSDLYGIILPKTFGQGQKGDKGDKGNTGSTGSQGDAGLSGLLYIPVIIYFDVATFYINIPIYPATLGADGCAEIAQWVEEFSGEPEVKLHKILTALGYYTTSDTSFTNGYIGVVGGQSDHLEVPYTALSVLYDDPTSYVLYYPNNYSANSIIDVPVLNMLDSERDKLIEYLRNIQF